MTKFIALVLWWSFAFWVVVMLFWGLIGPIPVIDGIAYTESYKLPLWLGLAIREPYILFQHTTIGLLHPHDYDSWSRAHGLTTYLEGCVLLLALCLVWTLVPVILRIPVIGVQVLILGPLFGSVFMGRRTIGRISSGVRGDIHVRTDSYIDWLRGR